MLRIELIADASAELGEGPLWDVGQQRFFPEFMTTREPSS
jgi:hypothetical protein